MLQPSDMVWKCPLLNWYRIIRKFLMKYLILTMEFQLMMDFE